MKRYQVYLDPQSVSVLDEFEKFSALSGSELIRQAIDRLAHNLTQLFVDNKVEQERPLIFDQLIGSIKLKHKGVTHYATKSDREYLND